VRVAPQVSGAADAGERRQRVRVAHQVSVAADAGERRQRVRVAPQVSVAADAGDMRCSLGLLRKFAGLRTVVVMD
jgi:hypothetical protein